MNAKLYCAVAFAVLCVAGCSSDPTSDQFKAFAEQYATKISGEKTSDNGDKRIVKAELSKFNLEKTNSLTVPFVGTAEYVIEIAAVDISHPDIKGYTGTATFENETSIRFGWVDGKWQPQGGACEITDSRLDSVDQAAVDRVGSLHANNSADITASEIDSGKVYILSGWANTTKEMIQKELNLP
jgi:hypothetical protein